MTSPTVKRLEPTTLRVILVAAMILALAGSVAGFVYRLGVLNTFAVDVSHKKVDAEASNSSLQTLQKLEHTLSASRETLKRTQQLSITNELPQFQAVTDVRNIADRNKLPITNITFTDSTASTPSSSTPAAPATPSAAAPVATSKQVDVTLTLGENVDYDSFLQFLYDTERSIPNMQIGEISLSPGSSRDTIKPGNITIKVSIR
jgi:hypothetical protein